MKESVKVVSDSRVSYIKEVQLSNEVHDAGNPRWGFLIKGTPAAPA